MAELDEKDPRSSPRGKKRRPSRSLWRRWRATLLCAPSLREWLRETVRYLGAWRRYRQLPGAEECRIADSHPQLFDRKAKTPVDKHYFYQGVWAMRRLAARRPARHVDVGSDHRWVGCLTTIVPVAFVDIRSLPVRLEGLESRKGSVLALPFGDNEVESLSCLHVVEHVGLGRYGDPLDTQGTVKACRELARVLAPGGALYLSMPVGRPRVCFNAHRILDPVQVPRLCEGLVLEEFSIVDDRGELIENADPAQYRDALYACGLYILTKPQEKK